MKIIVVICNDGVCGVFSNEKIAYERIDQWLINGGDNPTNKQLAEHRERYTLKSFTIDN